jgi:hypothetical protein
MHNLKEVPMCQNIRELLFLYTAWDSICYYYASIDLERSIREGNIDSRKQKAKASLTATQ